MHSSYKTSHKVSALFIVLVVLFLLMLLFPKSSAAEPDLVIHNPANLDTFIPPAVGESYVDPIFGSTIKRISDARNTPDSSNNSGVLSLITQEAPVISAFNADNSRLLLQHFSYFALYDGLGNFLTNIPFEINASSAPRWSRTDPAVFYFLKGNQLKRYNVLSANSTLVHEFTEYTSISGMGEADTSFDGDHLVLVGDSVDIFVYTLSTDSKGVVLEMPNAGDASTVYLTPDNNVLVTWDAFGTERYNGIELFDQDMGFVHQVATVGGHMDVARDTDGSEILIWSNAREAVPDPGCINGVVKISLADNQRTCLISLGWGLGLHISAPESGDSFYVSTHGPSPDTNWRLYQNEILRVSLDGGEIERLLHHYSQPSDGYYAQPRVSVSSDASRLVYASNFGLQTKQGYPTEYTDVYFVCLLVLCESPVQDPTPPDVPDGPPVLIPADLETFEPPAVGDTYVDQTFDTTIKRVTDARNTLDSSNNIGVLDFITQEYSSMSPFNSDNSRLLLQHFSYFALYDGLGNYLSDLPFDITASSEPRWSKNDPAVFYYLNGNQIRRYNVLTGVGTLVHEFTEYTNITSRGEADISFDGDHLVLFGDNIDIFVYTLSTDSKGAVLEMPNAGDANSLYLTPDNNVLVTWDESGAGRYKGIELYDQELNFLYQVTQAGGHMDVARDTNGEEILLWTNAGETIPHPGCENGIEKIHLADNQRTCMLSLDWGQGVHISAPESGDAFFVSIHGASPDADWRLYQNEILRVSLDGAEIERLLHHYSQPSDGYYDQPKVSASRDGSRLVYASNFGLQTKQGYPAEYTDVYFICLLVLCESPVHELILPEVPDGLTVLMPANAETFEPPALGESYVDQTFGTTIKRISDARNTPDSSNNSGVLNLITQEAPVISAFNADNSRLLLQHFSYFALYDGLGNYLADLPFEINASSAPRWSRTDPAVFYFMKGNQLKRYNVLSASSTLVHEFTDYSVISAKGEADISFDGDHLVLLGDNVDIFVYTLSTDSQGAVLQMPNAGDANSVYMTPDNNVLVTWDAFGTERFNGIELFDQDMNFVRQVTTIGGHMDVARDTDNSEILLWSNAREGVPDPGCINGVVKISLVDNQRTCLISLGWGLGLHVSAPESTGSFYVSTRGPSPDANWRLYQNEILRVSLDGVEIERLLHHYSQPSDGYYDSARVSVSHTGDRLVYASNFGLQGKLGFAADYTDVYFVCLQVPCLSPVLETEGDVVADDEVADGAAEPVPPVSNNVAQPAGNNDNSPAANQSPPDINRQPLNSTSVDPGAPDVGAGNVLVDSSVTNELEYITLPTFDYSAFLPPSVKRLYVDLFTGSVIQRLTDSRNTSDSANGGILPFITHEYSSMSPFNSDNSRLLLQHFSYFALYDGAGNYLTDLPFDITASSEPRWSRNDPAVFYYLNGNQIRRYNVQTRVASLVQEFPEYSKITSRGEADISFDGDHLVLFDDNMDIFVYTLSTDSKGEVLELPNAGSANSLYLTPDNNVLITWDDNGAERYNGIELYDQDMGFVHQVTMAGGHMDVARDNNGEEILLWANAGEPNPDSDCRNGVMKITLADNQRTCLIEFDWSMALHISAPEINNGGFVISTYLTKNSTRNPVPAPLKYRNSILQVSLDGSSVTELGLHWSRALGDYYYQPKAAVSRDGTRLVFDSNFNLQEKLGYPENYTDVYYMCISDCENPGAANDNEHGWILDKDLNIRLYRYQNEDDTVEFQGSWDTFYHPIFSGSSVKVSSNPGDSAIFSFYGSAVSWLGYAGRWAGRAKVTLDDEQEFIVDGYSAKHRVQERLFTIRNLEEKTHTLKIEVIEPAVNESGKKRWVWLDAFDIYPCPPEAVCEN